VPARLDSAFKVLIHESELDNLAGWVLEHPDRETGGDLFGFWTHSGSPTVQLVLGPGQRARHEVGSFFQDPDHLQYAGEHVQNRYGLQHIGDWHSHHHLGLAVPSRGDASTARHVFDYTDFPRFLLLIANIKSDDDGHASRWRTRGRLGGWNVEVGAFLFERGESIYRRGQWVVLPETNPVAESVRAAGVAGRPRQLSRAWSVERTTLDSSLGEHREPAAGWYTSAWGKSFLRSLDEKCKKAFFDCHMSLAPETGKLVYTLTAGEHGFSIGFPGDYPDTPSTFTAGDDMAIACDEPPTDDAEGLFQRLLQFVKSENQVALAASRGAERDDALEKLVVQRELTDGMEPAAAGPTGAGASDSEGLLPDPGVAQPG
jgi:hypothetical protein